MTLRIICTLCYDKSTVAKCNERFITPSYPLIAYNAIIKIFFATYILYQENSVGMETITLVVLYFYFNARYS